MKDTTIYLFDGKQFFCEEEIENGTGGYTRVTWWSDRPDIFTNTEMDYIINCYNVFGPGGRVNIYPLRELNEDRRYRIVFLPPNLEYQKIEQPVLPEEEEVQRQVDLYFDGMFFYDSPIGPDWIKTRRQLPKELSVDEVNLVQSAFREPDIFVFEILLGDDAVYRIEKVAVDYAISEDGYIGQYLKTKEEMARFAKKKESTLADFRESIDRVLNPNGYSNIQKVIDIFRKVNFVTHFEKNTDLVDLLFERREMYVNTRYFTSEGRKAVWEILHSELVNLAEVFAGICSELGEKHKESPERLFVSILSSLNIWPRHTTRSPEFIVKKARLVEKQIYKDKSTGAGGPFWLMGYFYPGDLSKTPLLKQAELWMRHTFSRMDSVDLLRAWSSQDHIDRVVAKLKDETLGEKIDEVRSCMKSFEDALREALNEDTKND